MANQADLVVPKWKRAHKNTSIQLIIAGILSAGFQVFLYFSYRNQEDFDHNNQMWILATAIVGGLFATLTGTCGTISVKDLNKTALIAGLVTDLIALPVNIANAYLLSRHVSTMINLDSSATLDISLVAVACAWSAFIAVILGLTTITYGMLLCKRTSMQREAFTSTATMERPAHIEPYNGRIEQLAVPQLQLNYPQVHQPQPMSSGRGRLQELHNQRQEQLKTF